MAGLWRKAPSPCIGVCKFRDAGHCVGCRMTKPEKKRFKRLEGKSRKRAFFVELSERLQQAGRYAYWARMYRRRCEKKDRPCPLDKLEGRD
ncbi:hypothetical protein SAMN02745911_1398 [Aureimonas altamirensis DSM 21988]|uniref:DUF1289 domain-containing protein n=1 Tax=Aureimonas altamirensis DSM 21988 TaxID=1121026 RepID=A0ABY1IDD9_9HYPH|nr:DUF1289 domain-containing protein [Aureimonas altamirensis]SHJ01234.1 hypothetical protein SAMN02745911_1398 [Aureimonas altamirensis DSM 21988]